MSYLVIIPARGGSKGLPRKNILPLNGKPLILYTVEAAREVFNDSHIYVSTDDKEIVEVVESSGLKVPFLRPSHLATDSASTLDVLRHAIEFYEKEKKESPDIIVLLQPTSPLRNADHLRDAVTRFTSDMDMMVSVFETKSNPYYVLFEENNGGFLKKLKDSQVTRRQDLPKVWEVNGAIYLISVPSFKKCDQLFEMDKIVKFQMDAKSSIDIDDIDDFRWAEVIMKSNEGCEY